MSKAIRGVLCGVVAAATLGVAAMPAAATEGWSTGEVNSSSDDQCQAYADEYDRLRDQASAETVDEAWRRMTNAAEGVMTDGMSHGCFFIESHPEAARPGAQVPQTEVRKPLPAAAPTTRPTPGLRP